MSDTPSLGARWVAACRRADVEPWAAGMRWLAWPRAGRVLSASPGCVEFGAYIEHERLPVPVLDDPATVGAAIGVLRAWSGDSCVFTRYSRSKGSWRVSSVAAVAIATGATEAEAIVAAAEALAAGGGR